MLNKDQNKKSSANETAKTVKAGKKPYSKPKVHVEPTGTKGFVAADTVMCEVPGANLD